MVSVNDVAARPARALADGEVLAIGRHKLKWFDAPHVPHGWECGFMMETETRTLLCGDLFTQGGSGATPVTDADILEPSEAFRLQMDYYAHAPADRRHARAPRARSAAHPRLHARQRLARRRRRAPARARPAPLKGSGPFFRKRGRISYARRSATPHAASAMHTKRWKAIGERPVWILSPIRRPTPIAGIEAAQRMSESHVSSPTAA